MESIAIWYKLAITYTKTNSYRVDQNLEYIIAYHNPTISALNFDERSLFIKICWYDTDGYL